MELTGKDNPIDFESVEKLTESRISSAISLSQRLTKDAEYIINSVIENEDERNNLRSILLLRNPKTGEIPQTHEIQQFLCDLPSYILTVHVQYLNAKKEKEKLLAKLRPEAERLLAEEKMQMKRDRKIPTSLFGQITKEDIRDKMHSFAEFPLLIKWEEEESALDMIVKLLGYRRYELSSILEIELKGV
jgi:hypothetical protein